MERIPKQQEQKGQSGGRQISKSGDLEACQFMEDLVYHIKYLGLYLTCSGKPLWVLDREGREMQKDESWDSKSSPEEFLTSHLQNKDLFNCRGGAAQQEMRSSNNQPTASIYSYLNA